MGKVHCDVSTQCLKGILVGVNVHSEFSTQCLKVMFVSVVIVAALMIVIEDLYCITASLSPRQSLQTPGEAGAHILRILKAPCLNQTRVVMGP